MAGSIDCLLFSCVFPHPFKEPLSAASLRMRPCRSGGVGPPPPERRPPSGEGVERQHVRDVARTSVHWNGLTAKTSRKEVFQPHLPVRLPCYDFTPLTEHTFGGALLAVRLPTSGVLNSGGVTGGVYKARERIHRAVLMRDY